MLKFLVCLLYSILIFDNVVNSSFINRRVKRSSNCGVVKSEKSIDDEKKFESGRYPWMTALMEKNANKLDYFCGGVLISQKKTLTTANCIHPKAQRRKLLRDILVMLGVHYLTDPNETSRINKSPLKIFIHPDWNPFTLSFDGDISILEFEDAISIREKIQPICLWQSDDEPTETEGVMVGYERNEDENTKIESLPSQLKISIVSNEKCLLSDPSLARISSEETFCAATTSDEIISCLDNIGHGLFTKQNDAFYLRGLVSSSSCDTSKYTVFTDVLKYKRWIDEPFEEYPKEIVKDKIIKSTGVSAVPRKIIHTTTSVAIRTTTESVIKIIEDDANTEELIFDLMTSEETATEEESINSEDITSIDEDLITEEESTVSESFEVFEILDTDT